MNTNQDEAFLAAIRADPDDDTVRLVYADWLAENGESARAEFIRAECAAHHLPEWSAERDRAEERAAQLFVEHATRWLGKWPEGLDNSLVQRGFWFHLTFPRVREFIRAAERGSLRRLAPVQTLRITHRPESDPDGLRTLAASPALSWVEALAVDDSDFDDELAGLFASSPHARSLRGLTVEDARELTVEGVSALLADGAPPGLVELGLWSAQLGDAGLQQIARLPGLARLKRLRLHGCGFGDAGAAALVRSPHLSGIEELSLGCLNYYERHTRIGDETLTALARPRRLTALRKLTLVEAQAQPESWRAFARSPLAGRLAHLDIDQTRFAEQGVEALFHSAKLKPEALGLGVMRCPRAALELLLRSPVVRAVQKLDLSNMSDNFGNHGAKVLAQQPPLEHLRELNLAFNQIGNAGAKALANSPALSALRKLVLAGNEIGPVGAGHLARAQALAGLTQLQLSNTDLGDEGLDALASATFAGSLRALFLGFTQLTAAGVARLVRTGPFPNLRRLDLNENKLGAKGAQAILKSPMCAALRNLTFHPEDVPQTQLKALRRQFGARLYLMTDADYV
jgi:uncharacterized protein (TIGR02996 family)